MLSNQEIKKVQRYLEDGDVDMALTKIFKSLSDINRCKIFRMLAVQTRLSVSSVAKVLNISTPLASQHLKILTQNGLLTREKLGIRAYYKLKDKNPIIATILKVIK